MKFMAFYIYCVQRKNRAETKKIKNLIPRQKNRFGVRAVNLHTVCGRQNSCSVSGLIYSFLKNFINHILFTTSNRYHAI